MAFVVADVMFSNPALWAGAVGLGVPLLIHLLTRRTPRKLVFPTVRFLLAARAKQSSLYRLRHLLLLIARTALLILLLIAFLKPLLLRQGGGTVAGGGGARAMVILMDVSASMGYTDGATSPFSRAKVAATKILDSGRAADRVNLIQMGAMPRGSFDAPSENLFLLRKDIQEADLTAEAPDVGAALAEAVRQLQPVRNKAKQILLVSDFQRSNWSAVDFTSVPADTELVFVPVGPENGQNVAITEVAVRPVCPTVAETAEIVCKVANYTDQTRQVPLELRFRDGETFQQDLSLLPGTTTSTSFTMRIHTSGQYEGQLTIGNDGLQTDNQRYFTLDIAEKVDVLLVCDEDPRDVRIGSRFVETAINPFRQGRQATAEVSVVRSDQLNAFDVTRAQIVLLAGLNELTQSTAGVLLDYLRNGGSIVYFLVDGAGSQNLQRLERLSEGDFVSPFRITAQVDLSQRDEHVTWSEANYDHPALKKFTEATELGDLQFTRYFGTERVPQKGQVLLRYNDGNIAMAQATVGPGAILLCNFSCSVKHSDIAKHALFVPLMHEIVKGMRPASGGRNSFVVGDQCHLTADALGKEDRVEFKNPSGDSVDGNVDAAESGVVVFFPQTDRCGFYRVYRGDDVVGAAAVNMDPAESNLETLDIEQLKVLVKAPRTAFANLGPGAASIERTLGGKEIWHWFLLGAIGLFCLEQLLVVLCRR